MSENDDSQDTPGTDGGTDERTRTPDVDQIPQGKHGEAGDDNDRDPVRGEVPADGPVPEEARKDDPDKEGEDRFDAG